MRASSRSLLQLLPSRLGQIPTPACFTARPLFKRCQQRSLQESACRRRAVEDPSNGSSPPSDGAAVDGASIRGDESAGDDSANATTSWPSNNPNNGPDSSRPKEAIYYGSAARRSKRNKAPKEAPPVDLPQWLFKRNIMLAHEAAAEYRQHIDDNDKRRIEEEKKSIEEDFDSPFATDEHMGLRVSKWVRTEAGRLFNMALTLPPSPDAEAAAKATSHFVLCCPKSGTSEYLKWFVREQLWDRHADFLQLSAQDIALIGGPYTEDTDSLQPNTLSSLGYDASIMLAQKSSHGAMPSFEEQGMDENEDEDTGSQHDQTSSSSMSQPKGTHRVNISESVGIIPMGSIIGNFQEVFKNLGPFQPSHVPAQPNKAHTFKIPKDSKDVHDTSRLSSLIEALLNAPKMKLDAQRIMASTAHATPAEPEDAKKREILTGQGNSMMYPLPLAEIVDEDCNAHDLPRTLVVVIEDYPQVNATISGGRFLDKLHDAVLARRANGQKTLVIGTASSKDTLPSMSKSGVDEVQSETNAWTIRTIVVPVMEASSLALYDHERAKTNMINLRHLRDMIRRLAPNAGLVSSVVEDEEFGAHILAFPLDISSSVWPVDRVHRIACCALGAMSRGEEMSANHVEVALRNIHIADEHKYEWIEREKQVYDAVEKIRKEENSSETKLQKLRKTCDSYEKKLLHGVVDADSIKTTFADVRAQPGTIDALKTLTSLSLIRPDAFSYGVLATDRIPGLLLYGPPGTGKTLLAKAVAKESGATVLEVSGSDVYNMYVGEGEKNVRAIFSLAKKLTPCIIFIDEADAILGSRDGSSNRTSHRDIINQFLREWDGMTDLSAFIMVATNRPFDLDEASLRRLPRRLLIDLPVEKDREEILKIHLKHEILDPEVSLSKLASETPFYSGSDLKNICVAAALACVREEFETATAHNKTLGESTPEAEKFKYAEKRTLCLRHFTKGMDEISASVSEDMGSLSAIRKFDEKYGDRKGKRKKLGAYGFKTVNESDAKGSDAIRVRNQ